MEELANEIRVALPYITDRRMGLLKKCLEGKGVHSKDDMSKLEAVDLVNTLGTADAKKLVAYFNYARVFQPGVRTEDLEKAKVGYEELNTKLDEELAKREQVHEETLCDIDRNMLEISENHDATLEQIKKTMDQSSRAHEEMLQKMQEEERLRAERRAQRQRELEEELKRLESSRSNPARSFRRVIGSFLEFGKEAIDLMKK